jgi:hypothetical protein
LVQKVKIKMGGCKPYLEFKKKKIFFTKLSLFGLDQLLSMFEKNFVL